MAGCKTIMLVYHLMPNIQDGGQQPEVVRNIAISSKIVVLLNPKQESA